MKLRDAASWLPNHLDRVERLGQPLGPTLVQLPPRWKRNVERLDEFLTVAPKTMRWAVELRDAVVVARRRVRGARAARRRAVHPRPAARPPVGADHRLDLRALPRAERAEAASTTALRRHAACAPWAERLAAWLDGGHDVYAYFNNDYEGHAVNDAEWLRDALAQADGVAIGVRP